MTHILILQGTPTGAPLPAALHLMRVLNAQQFGGARVDYRVPNELHPARVVNQQAFGALTLRKRVVLELSQAHVANISSIGANSVALLPFEPANEETNSLFAVFTGSYETSAKRQIDRLISELKSRDVWAKLDWYGNAFWATTEHDALLNWINPAQTLTKVGGASWIAGQGLKGVHPATDPGRYKSGWNVGDGPNSSATSFALFCKITSIETPQDGMQPMGLLEYSTPGPSAPDGSFIILSVAANSGSAGANVLPFNGNTGFAVGDGLGVWGTSRAGAVNMTVKDGIALASNTVSGVSTYMHPEGICVAGSGPGFLAQRSFPGTELYWGWGAAMSAAEFGSLEAAFQTALLPPSPTDVSNALLLDGGANYLIDADARYLKVDA